MTFLHTDPGTGESAWAEAGLAALPALPMDPARLAATRFVVLAAHPDDETLGAGGLMATLHAAGAEVDVLLCTAGEGSHPGSPTHSPEQLSALRTAEFGARPHGAGPGGPLEFPWPAGPGAGRRTAGPSPPPSGTLRTTAAPGRNRRGPGSAFPQ